jgi:hypothetical protein
MLWRYNWLVSKDLVFLRDTSKVVGKQKVNCDAQLLKQTVADRTDQFGLLFCVQKLEEYTTLIYPLFHSHPFNSSPFMAALPVNALDSHLHRRPINPTHANGLTFPGCCLEFSLEIFDQCTFHGYTVIDHHDQSRVQVIVGRQTAAKGGQGPDP